MSAGPAPRVRALGADEAAWAHDVLTWRWGGTSAVSRGAVHDLTELPTLVAELDGERAGLATYRIADDACELVTLDALRENAGVGTALIEAVAAEARNAGAERLWLITSNDNLPALRFYQRRGLDLVAVHHDAITRARVLKPSIPRTGLDGIAIRHELELEWPLRS